MNKLHRIAVMVNWTVLVYLAGITILGWNGKIAYGHGMGDVVYVKLSLAFAILHLIAIVLVVLRKQRAGENDAAWVTAWVVAMLYLAIAAAFTHKFTLGRGPERTWDGNVFVMIG